VPLVDQVRAAKAKLESAGKEAEPPPATADSQPDADAPPPTT
jgi:hypothetical protein